MSGEKRKVTAYDLQLAFYRTNWAKYEFVAPNVYLKWNSELDIFALRKGSGYVDEIEVKLSKSDFLADFKKQVVIDCEEMTSEGLRLSKYIDKHDALQEGLLQTNRFSFLMPEKLVESCKIPKHCGLYIYTSRGRIKQVKRAPLLHKLKISNEVKYFVAKKLSYRYWRLLALDGKRNT